MIGEVAKILAGLWVAFAGLAGTLREFQDASGSLWRRLLGPGALLAAGLFLSVSQAIETTRVLLQPVVVIPSARSVALGAEQFIPRVHFTVYNRSASITGAWIRLTPYSKENLLAGLDIERSTIDGRRIRPARAGDSSIDVLIVPVRIPSGQEAVLMLVQAIPPDGTMDLDLYLLSEGQGAGTARIELQAKVVGTPDPAERMLEWSSEAGGAFAFKSPENLGGLNLKHGNLPFYVLEKDEKQ